jgi:hypothetical protein
VSDERYKNSIQGVYGQKLMLQQTLGDENSPGLRYFPNPFSGTNTAWVGGSIFASLKVVVIQKYFALSSIHLLIL